MKQKQSKKAAATLLAPVLVLVIAIGLVVELLRIYVPDVWAAFSSGDENALQACFSGQNAAYSAGLLWLLSFVQILSVILPAMPVQLAAGIVLGPWLGAHMAVYRAASHTQQRLLTLGGASPKLEKARNFLANARHRTYYTVILLLVPGLPNGIIPYAAAYSGMPGRRYLLALLLSLPLPTFATCLAGNLVLSGDWWLSVAILAALYGIVGILFLMRDSLPDKACGAMKKIRKK